MVRVRLGRDPDAEHGEDDRASGAQASDDECVPGRNEVLEQCDTRGGWQISAIQVVFDDDGNALQRPRQRALAWSDASSRSAVARACGLIMMSELRYTPRWSYASIRSR